jgi:hypothetical protein
MPGEKTTAITIKKLLTIGIALVWLINGLFCKILNLVPRHEWIVARILGHEYAGIVTKLIGAGEVLIFLWIISGIKPRLCAIVQIVLVATMNIIEFFLARDLLLFGQNNILFAALLIIFILINGFLLTKKKTPS